MVDHTAPPPPPKELLGNNPSTTLGSRFTTELTIESTGDESNEYDLNSEYELTGSPVTTVHDLEPQDKIVMDRLRIASHENENDTSESFMRLSCSPMMIEQRKSMIPSGLSLEELQTFDMNFGRSHFYRQMGKHMMYSAILLQSQKLEKNDFVSSSIIHQGLLSVQKKVMMNFTKRWCELRRTTTAQVELWFYRQKPEDKNENPHRRLILTTMTSIRPPDKHSDTFTLVIPKTETFNESSHESSNDSYECQSVTCTSENALSWIAAIELMVAQALTRKFHPTFPTLVPDLGSTCLIVRYGIRKRNTRGFLQTRVLELDFANRSIVNSKRGDVQTRLPFGALRRVSVCSPERKSDGFGLELDFSPVHRPWPVFHDTIQARDDMMSLLKHILDDDVSEASVRRRCPQLHLKTGVMTRVEGGRNEHRVGPHATLKGQLRLTLHEYQLQLYPVEPPNSNPWFLISLPGLEIAHNASEQWLTLGRHVFRCESEGECRSWFRAIQAAAAIPPASVQKEMSIRRSCRQVLDRTTGRIRTLLRARVTREQQHQVPQEYPNVQLMLKVLWLELFPGQVWTGNTNPKWLEIGFQRGGPESDLRASGLLGLHCLIYFVNHEPEVFQSILTKQKAELTGGRMLNYPVAIACINVVIVLVNIFRIDNGDRRSKAQSHSWSASTAFVAFVASAVEQSQDTSSTYSMTKKNTTDVTTDLDGRELDYLNLVHEYEQNFLTCDNVVFEQIFCIVFPVLDTLFTTMGAGYMEFPQVLEVLKNRLHRIFALEPTSMEELKDRLGEPFTEKIVDSMDIRRHVSSSSHT